MDDKQIGALLTRAARLVTDLDLPEHLQVEAFRHAVGLLTTEPSPSRASTEASKSPAQTATGQMDVATISRKLGISAAEVENVFTVDGDQLQLIVAPSRLSNTRRAAMRELILLYVIGRQTGGWDASSTSIATVRSACESYGPKFFDTNNFMNAIADLGDALRKVGEGKDLRLILTPSGVDMGKQLIRKVGVAQSNPA
jgi:hypothetical protein